MNENLSHRPAASPRKRVWAQDVRVDVDVLGSRLNEIVARSETLSGRKDAIRRSVEKLLEQAENAANGDNPRFLWVRSWWRGTLIEAAYQNLHAAEAEIVPLYDQLESRPSSRRRSPGWRPVSTGTTPAG